jgi:hypothetical protein
VLIDGRPAPVGTLVEAYSPRGEMVDCSQTGLAGAYPFLRVYSAEGTSPVGDVPCEWPVGSARQAAALAERPRHPSTVDLRIESDWVFLPLLVR